MSININIFDKLIHNFKIKVKLHEANKEVFKVRAYTQALNKLQQNDNNIISTIDDIKAYNFGKSIYEKSVWLLQNDSNLEEVDNISKSVSIIEELTGVHNIGVSKARELVNKHNIKGISDLKEQLYLLNDKQKSGLKYYTHMMARIPREEIVEHEKIIKDIIMSLYSVIKCKVQIVGSYRRLAKDSGDIDVIITFTDGKTPVNAMKTIIDKFQSICYIPNDGIFASGSKKFMGMCKLPTEQIYRRLDIMITSAKEYPFALLYFTGSGEFNIKMRDYANSLGFSMNEKQIIYMNDKTEVKQHFQNEQDIFKFLNIHYLHPEQRNSQNFKILDN
jgi:DNA polymerase/3'-5' exonuclease PolX|uniref:DNA-directed DNA polymerase X domain-containing protein n=1 Tax=viral metagenome TaxID=1070528 RepID=A0A6C0BPV7_9ZZZZ